MKQINRFGCVKSLPDRIMYKTYADIIIKMQTIILYNPRACRHGDTSSHKQLQEAISIPFYI